MSLSKGNNDGDILKQVQKLVNGMTPQQAGLPTPAQKDEIARRLEALADEQGNLNKATAELAEKSSKDISWLMGAVERLAVENEWQNRRINQLEQALNSGRPLLEVVGNQGDMPAKRAGVQVWVMRVIGMRVIE